MQENDIVFKDAIMYKTVNADLSDLANVYYDIIVFFSPAGIKSLFENCFGIDPNSIFNAIATGEMVKRKKPDSELYLLALNKLSLDPSVCIAFEDSNIGLLSAKKAKITTICSPSEYHLDDDFKMADFICEEFTKEKLPSNLRQLILS